MTVVIIYTVHQISNEPDFFPGILSRNMPSVVTNSPTRLCRRCISFAYIDNSASGSAAVKNNFVLAAAFKRRIMDQTAVIKFYCKLEKHHQNCIKECSAFKRIIVLVVYKYSTGLQYLKME